MRSISALSASPAPWGPLRVQKRDRSRVFSKALKSLSSERLCQVWEGLATLWGHVVLLMKSWPYLLRSPGQPALWRGSQPHRTSSRVVLTYTALTLPREQGPGEEICPTPTR